jgi:hypothetical protein
MKNRLRLLGGVAQTSAFVVIVFVLTSTKPLKCDNCADCCGHFGGLLYTVFVDGYKRREREKFKKMIINTTAKTEHNNLSLV